MQDQRLLDFKKLILARFLFSFATRTQAVVVGWTMYALTRDPLHLGLVGLAEAVPAIGLAMVAGYVVDHSRPVRIWASVVLGTAVSAVVVLVSQTDLLSLDTNERVMALYLSSVIGGMARAFSQPSMYAIVPRLRPRDQLSNASAWMTWALQMASVSGPAIGGLLYGWGGIVLPARLDCAMLMIAWLAVLSIGADISAQPQAQGRSRVSELTSGVRFVFGHPLLLPALTLDMFSVLFGGVSALLPIFASDILKIGPMGLGALRAAPAVGAAFTTLTLARFVDVRRKAGTWLFTVVTGFGLCILVFGLSTSFALSMAALAFSGAFDSISMVIRGTAVQLASPDEMRGRISAVNSIFIGSSNEIGELESGVLAKLAGTVPCVLIGGVACLFTVGVVWVMSPTLRRLDLVELEVTAKP